MFYVVQIVSTGVSGLRSQRQISQLDQNLSVHGNYFWVMSYHKTLEYDMTTL